MLSRRELLAAALAAGALPRLLRADDTRPREVAWLAEVQRPRHVADPSQWPHALLPEGATIDDWRVKRAELLRWWREFVGLPLAKRPAPVIETVAEETADGVVRRRIRYDLEKDRRAEAFLLIPEERATKGPGIVVFHSTLADSIRSAAGLDDSGESLGWDLARAGFVTLCPRSFLWASDDRMDPQGQMRVLAKVHPGAKGMAALVHDGQVALDVLAAVRGVDPARLGAVGHSLGGKEVLHLAALDDRVAAAVCSEFGVGLANSNWEDPWFLGPEAVSPDLGHDQHELLALTAPRAMLAMGGGVADGLRTWPYVERALEIYRLYGEPARLGLYLHGRGHTVPPKAQVRVREWFQAYL